jgi:hypothetical protein
VFVVIGQTNKQARPLHYIASFASSHIFEADRLLPCNAVVRDRTN